TRKYDVCYQHQEREGRAGPDVPCVFTEGQEFHFSSVSPDDLTEPLFVPLPGQDFAACTYHYYREEEEGKAEPHDQQRDQHGRLHRRLAQLRNRRRLVQRVPPLDRVLDDRDIDDTDDRQQCAGAIGAVLVVDGRAQRHVAEVQEQQHQR